MKKSVTLVFALVFSGSLFTQSTDPLCKSTTAPRQKIFKEVPYVPSANIARAKTQKAASKTYTYFVQLGSSPNAYSTAYHANTNLWLDPLLNSMVFTHSTNDGSAGDIAYDLSTDAGMTWQIDNQVYESVISGDTTDIRPARFPQGLIINESGNTNPVNAFYAFLSATLDGTNGPLGGYAYGTNKLNFLPPLPQQTNLESDDETGRFRLNAFHSTQQGKAWYCGESSFYNMETGKYDYSGNLILGESYIVTEGIFYDEKLVDFLSEGEVINDVKIAFAPDGQTGYILAMATNSSNPLPYTLFHPIILKTMDGGETWSDPIDIQLGGEAGISKVKDYLADSVINKIEAYENWNGNRDQLWFNMGYHVDMVVDASGNPYIIGMIALASEEGWYPHLGTEWAVYSKDGGTIWDADPLWDQYWFEGMVGDLTMYNRPQASIDYDGEVIFYSWLDSEIEAAEENNRPNIYQVGYHIGSDSYSEIDNLTYFTQAWNIAFLASASYYSFKWSEFSYSVPYVYVEFTEDDEPMSIVNYWCLIDVLSIDVNEFSQVKKDIDVSQNYPNPATSFTEILVSVDTELPIELSINNMLGQIVYTDQVKSNAHAHSFSINVADFEPGIYLYSVKVGNRTVTKKMLVD